MVLKKFYGLSIQEALRDAREQMGDEVVLVESFPAEGERPASVTVMLDKQVQRQKLALAESEESGFRNVFYQRSAARPLTDKSQDKQSKSTETETAIETEKTVKKPSTKKTIATKNPRPKHSQTRESEAEDPEEVTAEPKGIEPDRMPQSMSRRKTPLIEIKASQTQTNGAYRDPAIGRELSAVHRRLGRLEAMLSESLISANLDYASHTTFQRLLQTGIRATTIAAWFKEVLNEGIDPFEDQERFENALAKKVRDAISVKMPQGVQPNMVFMGPSGSGKTSLIMKLATHPDFFSGQRIAVVSLEPRNSGKVYSPLEPFCADHDIDFYRALDGIEISKIMMKLVDYDQVLIDTPAVSLEKETAFREYWKLRQMLAAVLPLEVHFVLNATLEQHFFKESFAKNHPLQPDYLAITHLDETPRWGHLVPFIKTMGCSIRYISTERAIPDGLSAFSATWFAENIIRRT